MGIRGKGKGYPKKKKQTQKRQGCNKIKMSRLAWLSKWAMIGAGLKNRRELTIKESYAT